MNKKSNSYVPNRQGEVKNSIGNGEAKELICMTHGRGLRGQGESWWEGVCSAERNKGRKNQTTVIA